MNAKTSRMTFADFQAKYPKLARGLAVTAGTFSEIKITTQTALKFPDPEKLSTKGLGPEWERRSAEDREAEAKRRDAQAVALSQPHRRGARYSPQEATDATSAFARLATPLGRFCTAQHLRRECYDAGERYAEFVRQSLAARGFAVPGLVQGEAPSNLTEDQKEALREAAVLRERAATQTLRSINPRLPRVMERFCYEQLELPVADGPIAIRGLMALARDFGMVDEGINQGKGDR